MLYSGIASVGWVTRLPPDDAGVVPDPAGVPEAGVVAAGEVWVPVHPAMARALQRSTIIITMILNCIPENASRCYIMLALVIVPCSKKLEKTLKNTGTGFIFSLFENPMPTNEALWK
jgi:hypothetical protein